MSGPEFPSKSTDVHRLGCQIGCQELTSIAAVLYIAANSYAGRVRLHPEPNEPPLPRPGSEELHKAVTNGEARQVYRFLYERRGDPPTMNEVRRYMERQGVMHEHTGRRLRQLRGAFEIQLVPNPSDGRNPRYFLKARRTEHGKYDESRITAKMEAQVYAEWGQRCAMCGRTPKDDGVKLRIDHIIPRDWGGSTEPENLQPLCEEHNHGKQAWVSSLDPYAGAIRTAISLESPYERIGELLKAMEGEQVAADLIYVVAREENRGDALRRLRDLRDLGWEIDSHRRKVGKRTLSFYELRKWRPWPPEGAAAAVRAVYRMKGW